MTKLFAKKILVTGAAGFIGSHIVDEAAAQGIQVVALDNLVAGKLDNLEHAIKSGYVDFLNADITECRYLSEMHPDVDIVFHNAASKCTVCQFNPKTDLEVNAYGTLNMARYARKVGARFVHASTGSVNQGMPASFYGISKMAAEHYLRVLQREGLDYCGLRYHHVFGPRQPWDNLGGVIPIFIRNVCWNENINIFGSGTQVRLFTYVEDIVNANFIVANSPAKKICDVAAREKISIYDLARAICRIMGKPHHPIVFADERIGDIQNFEVHTEYIKSLGWEPEMSFGDNLHRTIDWYVWRLQ